ncbi:hypothetical protein [Myxosarcina sp. GI1]|uniref:hypothetical protein n=1 Tax=Myxosarcina sp. GI1 TaxID=1541065 RepID=UPI00055C57C2|nr:hypothetical protein [Myxosarcina sp. GI1]
MFDSNKPEYSWRKVIYSLAVATSAFLATELPVNALPETALQIAQVRSRAIAPRSLNVTPPPGRHIPLPSGRSSYDRYHHRGYDFYGDRHTRYRHRDRRGSRGNTTIIIINPNRSDRYSNYRRSEFIQIIRP